MYSLCITFHIQDEHITTFIEFSREVIAMTRLEPECLWFDMLRSESERGVFLFYHAYQSEAGFQEHLTQPYVMAWFKRTRPLLISEGMTYPSHFRVYET